MACECSSLIELSLVDLVSALAIPASEIANIINADLRPRSIPDRFVARDIGPSQNGHLGIESLACPDRVERRSFERGAHGAAAVGLGHAGRDADIFIAAPGKQRRRHSIAVFLPD